MIICGRSLHKIGGGICISEDIFSFFFFFFFMRGNANAALYYVVLNKKKRLWLFNIILSSY